MLYFYFHLHVDNPEKDLFRAKLKILTVRCISFIVVGYSLVGFVL